MKIKIIGLFLTILSTISYSTAQNKIKINEGSGSFIINGGKGLRTLTLQYIITNQKSLTKRQKY